VRFYTENGSFGGLGATYDDHRSRHYSKEMFGLHIHGERGSVSL